jgi:hypothetical protein
MIAKTIIGLFVIPIWLVFMVTAYPIVWLGLRGWQLATNDGQPLDSWIAMWNR